MFKIKISLIFFIFTLIYMHAAFSDVIENNYEGLIKDEKYLNLDDFLKGAALIEASSKLQREEYKKKIIIIFNWATWCPYCKTNTGHLKKAMEKYGVKGLRIIAINHDKESLETESVKKLIRNYLEKYNVTWPNLDARSLMENNSFKSLNIDYMPFTVILGQDLRILYVQPDLKYIDAILKSILG
ncbi:MAG: TlpA disulfide reductase family protein [Pseudomonadota bacterium]